MKKSRITTALLAIGISASMVFQTPVFATEETAVAVSSGVTTNGISGWPQGPEITSASAVIMEDTSDTILYAKDMDTTLSPAGAVKIMTCLLALENSQLDDQVTMTETGVSGVTDGGAHISSQLGEVFTMEQCLYALMLASANDIALQVAEQIGGSVDAFVQKMNDRAKELGCTNTVFTNPTGLPDDNQHKAHENVHAVGEKAHKLTGSKGAAYDHFGAEPADPQDTGINGKLHQWHVHDNDLLST